MPNPFENFRKQDEQGLKVPRRPPEVSAGQRLGDLQTEVEKNISEQTPSLMLMDEANLLFQRIAGDPTQSRVYLHFILQILERTIGKDDRNSPVKLQVIREGYAKLSPEAKKIASEYFLDKIVDDSSELNFENFATILKQKAGEEKLQRARRAIGQAINMPLKDIIYLGDAVKSHQIVFDVDGIEVKATVKRERSRLGVDIFLTDLCIDGHDVGLTNLMFFRTHVRKSVAIAKAYKLFRETYAATLKRYPELRKRKIFYEDSNDTIFIETISDKDIRLMRKLKIPFVKTIRETDSTEFFFHNGNGMPYFKQISPNNPELRASRYDAGAFEIYDKKGEKILRYSEWLEQGRKEKSDASKNEYIDSYLSKKIVDDETLNLFFCKMLRYTNDDISMTAMSAHKSLVGSMISKSDDSREIFLGMPEAWQTWQQTLDREKNRAYLGDCDDYAFLAKRIFDAQKRGYGHVIAIPEHATAIAVNQNEDNSYTIQDVGTFEFTKITAPTLREAYEKLLERYKKTGVGVWQGQKLKLNPFDITVLDVQSGRNLASSVRYNYSVSLESLINPALLEVYLKIERLLFDSKSQVALQSIEQYKVQYPNEILFDKLAAIALFQLGRKEESVRLFEGYLKLNSDASQDDYEFLLSMVEKDENRFLAVVELMIDVLPEINYEGSLRGLKRFSFSDKKRIEKLISKMKSKISESSREDFWDNQLGDGNFYSLSEEVGKQFLREYLETVISRNGVSHIIEGIIEYSNELPADEQLTYAIRLMDKYPTNSTCNRLLLAVLGRAKKTELLTYLLENGDFDGKITMQAKACILGDIYLARGDAKKGLDVLSANLPKSRDEITESTSSLGVPEIYPFLLYEFKNRDPVRGEQFYLQNIQESSREFKCGLKYIIKGWVECKYNKVEHRTLGNIQADYVMLSETKYTNVHKFFYLKTLIDMYEWEKPKQFRPEDSAILNFIKTQLMEIRDHLMSIYPDDDAIPEYDETEDPADEKYLRYRSMSPSDDKTAVDSLIHAVDDLLNKKRK